MAARGIEKIHSILEAVAATAGDDVVLGDTAAVEGQLPGAPAKIAYLGDGGAGAALG